MPKTTSKKTSASNKRTMSPRTKRVLLVVNVLLLVGLSASTAYYASKYYSLRSETTQTQEQKNDKLVEEVGKVYSLPGDEKPVVALVADEQKFKEEYEVFTDAKKDDFLLLFEKAGLAVLYRPSDKKVIKTAPLSIQNDIGIALIGPAEQTAATEKLLGEKITSGIKVLAKNTGKQGYASVVVVDVSGSNKTAADQIAGIVGGVVGTLPEGEAAPEGADIVVVVATPVAPAPAPEVSE